MWNSLKLQVLFELQWWGDARRKSPPKTAKQELWYGKWCTEGNINIFLHSDYLPLQHYFEIYSPWWAYDKPSVNNNSFITTLGTDPSWRKGIWVSYLEKDFCSAAHLLKPQTDQTNQIFNLNKKTNKSLGILARAAGRLTSDLHHSLLSSNPASHLILGCSRPLMEAPIPSGPHSSSSPNFYTLTHDFISVPNSRRYPQGTHRQLQPGKPVNQLQNFTSPRFSPEPIPQSHLQICSRASVASTPHF